MRYLFAVIALLSAACGDNGQGPAVIPAELAGEVEERARRVAEPTRIGLAALRSSTRRALRIRAAADAVYPVDRPRRRLAMAHSAHASNRQRARVLEPASFG
mgnify:CR=1 FL=1